MGYVKLNRAPCMLFFYYMKNVTCNLGISEKSFLKQTAVFFFIKNSHVHSFFVTFYIFLER
jgi:hypothetical protein